MVSVSFSLSPRRPKDTRENILATKEFVVNIISEPFVEAANSTSVEAPEDVDEWTVAGLTKEPSVCPVSDTSCGNEVDGLITCSCASGPLAFRRVP